MRHWWKQRIVFLRSRLVWFGLIGVLVMPLLGCHTVRGAGEDIEEAGETIEDVAE